MRIIAGINRAVNRLLSFACYTIRDSCCADARVRRDDWDGTIAMGHNPNFRQIHAAARILLICPDCGQENAEFADRLRATSTFYCDGDGCDYIFSLGGPRRTIGSLAEACRRFYASFYALRRAR
jgi:hypothetical protein